MLSAFGIAMCAKVASIFVYCCPPVLHNLESRVLFASLSPAVVPIFQHLKRVCVLAFNSKYNKAGSVLVPRRSFVAINIVAA